MQHPTRKLLAATLPILAAILAGCNHDNPGTSVQVALDYDGSLGLDTAEVTLTDRTQSAPIERELLLLVPDELADTDMPIAVWGLRAGKRSAYGTVTAVPKRGKTIKASLTLTTCSPACQNDQLTTCTGPMVTCPLSCSEVSDPHCIGPKPSNGVDPGLADPLRGTTTISAATTLNTDTGAITGGVSRANGTGIDGGIGYFQAPAISAGGAPLGIFVFHNLTVDAAATLRFTGTHAAVLLVGDAAKIAGAIDVAAGHGAQSAAGPGGGTGGTENGPARGCGPGGAGARSGTAFDSGGGGGGGSQDGGPGGDTSGTTGGVVGKTCLPAKLEPLQGGSGGGRGSPGTAVSGASGGGGGGALQITALGSLEITGTINAGGAGGEGGPASATDAGAGGGGGSGGALLFESPSVMISDKAILTANGGGGGGGGSGTNGALAGLQGDNGTTSTATPQGGGGQESMNGGGSGGAVGPPDVGGFGSSNGGGGGGGVGAIVIRGRTKMLGNKATLSPPPALLDVQPSM